MRTTARTPHPRRTTVWRWRNTMLAPATSTASPSDEDAVLRRRRIGRPKIFRSDGGLDIVRDIDVEFEESVSLCGRNAVVAAPGGSLLP